MARGTWWATVHAAPESKTQLSDLVSGVQHSDSVIHLFILIVFQIILFYFKLCILFWGIADYRASLVAQLVKNLPVMQETCVRSLGWEDPLEEGVATHFSILAWRIPMDGAAWWATVHWVEKSQTRRSD